MEVILLGALVCIGIPGLMALLAFLTEKQEAAPVPEEKPLNRDSASKAFVLTFGLWALLTLGGVIFVQEYDFYPTVASDKGEEIASAFRLLTALAVPIAAMVISILTYNVVWRGTYDLAPEDGPPQTGRGKVPGVWFGATTALTLLVIIHPGMTALDKILDDPEPELVVNVEALQWTWLISYPSEGVQQQPELVIPVDKTVRFNITSRDVLHSFWVPSMLTKIDAVPGRTTSLTMKATETGDYASNPLIRLQCAELCGLAHSQMRVPVSVKSESDFRAWVQSKKK